MWTHIIIIVVLVLQGFVCLFLILTMRLWFSMVVLHNVLLLMFCVLKCLMQITHYSCQVMIRTYLGI